MGHLLYRYILVNPSIKWTSRLYIWSTRLTIHTVCANRSISVNGVAIDERDSVQKLKYPVGGQTCLCVVGGKGAGLSHRDGSKDKSSENTKYVLKRLVCYIVVGASDLVGAETEDGGIHEVDGGLREGVGESVHRGIDDTASIGR